MKQRVYLGNSSSDELFSILQKFSPSKLFLLRGKESYKYCGAEMALNSVFLRLGCEVVEFCDFDKNPKMEDLEKGIELLNDSGSSLVLAIGGRSVLDMAKLIRFFFSYSGDKTGNSFRKEQDLLPLIVLPTTAGTGSEATHFAVLYKDNIKYSVAHRDILPDVAIVDSRFTYRNPQYLTACTGFDALAQAIEAYWNVNATEESDKYALRSINLLWRNLLSVVESPTESVRDNVSRGSFWAGKAINLTKTTAPHAFSYPFTTNYGYPHGHAVALTFPFLFQYNLSDLDVNLSPDLNMTVYRKKRDILLGIMNVSIGQSCEFFIRYLTSLGLFASLNDIVFDKKMILNGVNMERLKNNPKFITHEFAVRMLNELEILIHGK